MSRALRCLAVAGFLLGLQAGALAQDTAETSDLAPDLSLDPEAAVARSQAAIGRSLGDHSFLDADNRVVGLGDYRGKPLIVALVFTACTESCPLIVQRLAEAVEVAQEALGRDSFAVVTVGFDAGHDTPSRMQAYARAQGVHVPGWRFLSGDQATVDALVEDLGFSRVPSPRGFDHIAQISIIDQDGRVHGHVYGSDFEIPALVEPLKVLALGEGAVFTDVAAVIQRVKLFCTFFDPKSGRYAVDYSFVISLAVGGLALLGLAFLLGRALWTMHHPPGGAA
jgi:protein SCO1/2